MKRNIKNAISIILIILLCGAMFFTVTYAKNNRTQNKKNEMSQNGGTPPEMPSGNNSNKGTPPEKPSGDDNNIGEPLTKPGENNTNSNTSELPTKPDGDNTDSNMGEPPTKPDEDNSNSESSSNENTQMPTGNPGGQMPEMKKASISNIYYIIFGSESLVLAAIIMYLIMSNFNKKTFKETFENKDKIIITVLSVIILTAGLTCLDVYLANQTTSSNENMQGPGGGGMNQSNSSIEYSSQKEITTAETITSGTYTSSTKDENAILVNGTEANISGITVNKTGDSDGGDSTSFYGTNSAILAKSGANLTLKNITVTTDATGANGVFCYGGSATTNNSSSDGTTVTISDSKITTTKDNSGGIMTTGGGTMNASNLEINTAGTSSAAIRTDRGGGTVTVDGGTYTTTGQGSPAIYSTADITVSDATLVAKASEGIVIEGKNSVTIDNVNLTDTNNKLNGQSTTYKNIFLYQSMSGDAADGTAAFTAKNSTITTNKGDSFYVTNTTATINLTNNTIVNNDTTGNFLRAKTDSWGKSGSNGGNVTLNMINQKAIGNIVIDSVSTLVMNMKSNSYYEGSINTDNSAKSITLTLDSTSTIKLTADTYVTSLENADATNSNIDFNGYKLYVNGTAIN